MSKVKNYLSLIKFSHTIFAMPFAFIGFIIGISSLLSIPYVKIHKDLIQTTWQKTNVYLINNYYFFILIVLCMIFARSAAMAFNRYLDRQYDAENPRTAVREIPAGVISAKNALIFTVISSGVKMQAEKDKKCIGFHNCQLHIVHCLLFLH